MTLKEIPLQESSAHGNTVDPQKAKTSRRRRIEIQRLKSTFHESKNGVARDAPNGVVRGANGVEDDEMDMCEVVHGEVSVMGRRREMEDAVRVEMEAIKIRKNDEKEEGYMCKYDYFGVYDGHGGRQVAEACRERMHVVVREEVDTWRKMEDGGDGIDWEGVMRRSFERVDEEVRRDEVVEEMSVGSTAVVAVVGKDEIVVANCGDSRALLFRNGAPLPLSLDHKPDRPDELARIEAAGGRVINWFGYRVSGVLATSRSIGDFYLKPFVSSTPEVTISKRTEADEFLILASDGLWDVVSNEVACQVVRRCLCGRIKSQELFNQISSNRAEVAAVLLAEFAIAKGSKDNISVIVVELKKFTKTTC